jgi:predicted Rdx family selenoprotein
MTGGVFTVTIWHDSAAGEEVSTQEIILWDRKRDGGFPGMLFLYALDIYIYIYIYVDVNCDVLLNYILGSLANHALFTEVKALKSLVRNVIAPERDLGHTDRALKAQQNEQKGNEKETKEETKDAKACEECQ